jgi:hypothetical protein
LGVNGSENVLFITPHYQMSHDRPSYTLSSHHRFSPHYSQHPSPASCSTSNSRSKLGESKTLAISSSLRFLFLGAKFVGDNLTLASGSGVGGIRWGAVQCGGLLVNGGDTGISTDEGEGESKAGESRRRSWGEDADF